MYTAFIRWTQKSYSMYVYFTNVEKKYSVTKITEVQVFPEILVVLF